jgi:uncharacterized membrane protein YecN with MAPEG domain
MEHPAMTFTPPLVSALTAGILILMQTALMLTVVVARRRNRQSLGDGGHHDLLLAMRRHGNLAENAAIFLAGFALLELAGGGRTGLAVLCAAFVLGRISHVVGLSMTKTVNPFRVGGVVLTAIVGVTLGTRLVVLAVSQLPL